MNVAAIVGTRGEGKTSAAWRVASGLASRGLAVAGIVAPAVWDGGVRIGYDVVDVARGTRSPFLRLSSRPVVGPFQPDPRGLSLAREALTALFREVPVGIIDEVGRWELSGGGHAWVLEMASSLRVDWLILVVRRSLVGLVSARWNLSMAQYGVAEAASLQEAVAGGGTR